MLKIPKTALKQAITQKSYGLRPARNQRLYEGLSDQPSLFFESLIFTCGVPSLIEKVTAKIERLQKRLSDTPTQPSPEEIALLQKRSEDEMGGDAASWEEMADSLQEVLTEAREAMQRELHKMEVLKRWLQAEDPSVQMILSYADIQYLDLGSE